MIGQVLVSISLLSVQSPPSGQALLDELSKKAVRFFWEQSDPTTGLTRDRASNRIGGEEHNPNIASIASTGYALASYPIGIKRGWLKKEETLNRARLTLK